MTAAPDAAPTDAASPDAAPDGRQLRRQRNRDAVVEALLDLYRDGNLRPGTEEIAARSGVSPRSLFRYFDDVDDLTRTAMERQGERARPLLPVGARPEDPLDTRIAAVVDQRIRLFEAVGNAATVTRLRAPFHPVLAAALAQNRRYLRKQISALFGPELAAMEPAAGAAALATIDVLTSFESLQLLRHDQTLPPAEAEAAITGALTAILGGAPARP